MSVPAFLPYYVLGGAIAVIVAIIVATNRALVRANWDEAERVRTMRVLSIVLVGWFLISIALAWFGVYRGEADRLPTIQFGIFVPILIGLALMATKTVRRVIDAVPQSWIVGVQVYRALGLVFILLYAMGELPALFAWPVGIGDIAAGLAAPAVALAYARDPAANARAVVIWNVVGIADLVVALATGFLTSPSPLQLFALNKPNELIAAFPLAIVPVFLVPLSILLHVASLAKLRRALPSYAHLGSGSLVR